jgi:hypothetical protein
MLDVVKFSRTFSFTALFMNGLLLFILLNEKLKSRVFYITYLVIVSIYFKHILAGDMPNEILVGGSRNVLSIILLFNLSLLHYIECTNKKNPSLFPSVLLAIISLWAIGRTGILVSLSYFFIVLYLRMNLLSTKVKYFVVCMLVCIICFLIYYFFYDLEILFNSSFEAFFKKGVNYGEDPRNDMLWHYLSKIDFFNFFFGYDYMNDAYYEAWEFNPHNSFIRLHSSFGIFFFISMCLIVYRLFNLFRRFFLFFIIVIFLLLRAWIDAILFWGYYDFIFFSLLLYQSRFYYLFWNKTSET